MTRRFYAKTLTNDEGYKVRVVFSTDNAAFEDYTYERQRIVNDAMRRNADGETKGKLMDTNGNTVGGFREER